jgi:hypothetical protein
MCPNRGSWKCPSASSFGVAAVPRPQDGGPCRTTATGTRANDIGVGLVTSIDQLGESRVSLRPDSDLVVMAPG